MDLKFYLEDLLGRPVDLVTDKGLRRELRPLRESWIEFPVRSWSPLQSESLDAAPARICHRRGRRGRRIRLRQLAG